MKLDHGNDLDTVMVRKHGLHKEDCCWKCANAYEAHKLSGFLMKAFGNDVEIVTIPAAMWDELEDYPNGR